MSGEITNLKVQSGDITQVTVSTSDITALTVRTADISVISTVPATINLANATYATESESPQDIARASSVGVLNIAARADHIHSIANTLLDGGNY